MNQAACPACNEYIPLKENEIPGELYNCPRCGTSIEIVSRFPLSLDYAEDKQLPSFYKIIKNAI